MKCGCGYIVPSGLESDYKMTTGIYLCGHSDNLLVRNYGIAGKTNCHGDFKLPCLACREGLNMSQYFFQQKCLTYFQSHPDPAIEMELMAERLIDYKLITIVEDNNRSAIIDYHPDGYLLFAEFDSVSEKQILNLAVVKSSYDGVEVAIKKFLKDYKFREEMQTFPAYNHWLNDHQVSFYCLKCGIFSSYDCQLVCQDCSDECAH